MIGFLARSSRSIKRVTGFKAREPPALPKLLVLLELLRGCLLLWIFPADLVEFLVCDLRFTLLGVIWTAEDP